MKRASMVMTFHAERTLAQWSLFGFERMRVHSERQGISVQLVAILDSADPLTDRLVESHPVLRPSDQVLKVDCRDPGLARNAGIAAADGQYLGILDGDDYCSANWIAAALEVLDAGPERVVHPEYLVLFGAVRAWARQTDQLAEDGCLETCFKHHLWGSTVFASRDLFLRFPYRETGMSWSGFGYEDWDWSLAVIAGGVSHTTAPNTALFYRQKSMESRQVEAVREQAVLRPGPFFAAESWTKRGSD
ncbi:glycosyltransferase family 2 protein [Pseudomonas jinjuensis]|uniref:glycosyltransferase family 2 protein n=1 Tax=Pseudomonas jinjuensis TaxID=198616 RepID=UPI000A014E85|nr:glycosyltransferase [Pseudomonas jinjuensis]